jgi:HAD superfamily hydrolase (TIGR01549 family)
VRIRAVLFDLGGTLVDERDFALWIELARRLSLELDAEELAHVYDDVQRSVDRGPPPRDETVGLVEFWRQVLAAASGREVDVASATRFLAWAREDGVRRSPLLFSDARRCLEELAAEKRRLAIVSNSTSEASVRRILHLAGILDFFEKVVSSGTEGIAKPDPEIFRRALLRLDVRPEESLYVGNLEWTDARGARAAGMQSVWLHRDGTGFGDDPPEISSLLEVPLVVRRLEQPPDRRTEHGPAPL